MWRSAIGVDRHGNLIYAAGDDQTVGEPGAHARARGRGARDGARHQLLLGELHHLRALPGRAGPTNLLPDMERSATRYLTPDDRDFFAVYSR